VFNDRGQYSIIDIGSKFPGLTLNKLPFNIVIDSEGNSQSNLELSDGSTQLYDSKNNEFTELIPKPKSKGPIAIVSPDDAGIVTGTGESGYVIGSNPETAESEIKVASILLFRATSKSKREALNLNNGNIDQAIKKLLDEKVLNSPIK
jgi:hypothetical protein